MLMFIVPPFFCPEADGRLEVLDAGPAKTAATSMARPSTAIAPEIRNLVRIALLSRDGLRAEIPLPPVIGWVRHAQLETEWAEGR
jgi:hypothetical protein